MDEKTIKALEFSKILSFAATYASSVPARAAINDIKPLADPTEIEKKLTEVYEADRVLYEFSISPSFAFDDVSGILDKADVMSVLNMGELLKVSRILRVARNIKASILKVPDENIKLIRSIAGGIFTDKTLEEDIDKAIISESEMHDSASPALRNIRSKIKRTGEAIKAKLYSYVNSSAYSKYIQDNIVTIRNDRFVIPLKAEYRSMIPGLIHDQSASGQTLYVEPMVIVEMNNTLKTHILEEEREIEQILRTFTMRVSATVEDIRQSYSRITDLDVIFAKAKYAAATKAIKPIINNKGYINIYQGRHPLISEEKVVPTNIRLGDEFDMLFVTGPNTGGKTVALKLVGLLSLMAMSGLYVPAKEAELSVFTNVFSDIGDEQSIEQNLSTFSSHMTNIVRITNKLDSTSLVLLDELGAGTDPTEGASLAVALSSFIKQSGAKAVITTHYNELKEYAVVTERAENASMDFDPVTYNPTYRLVIGTPGASNAILIAKKLGLNPTIIGAAQEGISDGKLAFENVLNSLEIARRNAEENERKTRLLLDEAQTINLNAQKERNRLFAQREKLNENVKKETKRLVEEAMEDANEIIDTLKSLLDDPTDANLFEARRLRKALGKYVIMEDNEFSGFGEEADGEIREGDTVFIKTLKVEGIVAEVNHIKGSAIVKLGRLRSGFKLDDLMKLKSKENQPQKVFKAPSRDLKNESFSPELNLIGQNTMEAVHNLNDYLDSALMSGVNEVRIIHGHGTGKLREAVKRHLKSHSGVKSSRDGGYDEGGRGVTVVILNK
ncbi:MAG: endonuclease MutS2 [Clostridia bacterium]